MADSDNDDLVHGFDISNLDKKDAFAEAYQGEGGAQIEKVHIRLQQRNRKKCILTVTGLAEDLDLKRICKALKKNFKCNGAVVKDPEWGEIIQLQGDHRQGVVQFLTQQEICPREIIVVHGH
jgi:translation initiation factor 1